MTFFRRMLWLVVAAVFFLPHADASQTRRVHVIAPLLIADPRVEGWRNHPEWNRFRQQLREARRLGVDAIEVDVWWGLVQRRGLRYFDWEYYERLIEILEEVNAEVDLSPQTMKLVLMLSTHQCGGNTGDGEIYIPIPEEQREDMRREGYGYIDETGTPNEEVVPPFATEHVIGRYRAFFTALRDRLGARYSRLISKIIVGMGPAGELTYPVSTFHPHRGRFFITGEHAQRHFRRWLVRRYRTIGALKEAWGHEGVGERWRERADYNAFSDIRMLVTAEQADLFFRNFGQYSAPGKDVLEWMHDALTDHGVEMSVVATEVFQANDSPLKGVEMAFKTPGVHWRRHDRTAEQTAGLIHPRQALNDRSLPANWNYEVGLGYESLFERTFARIKRKYAAAQFSHVKWSGIFTCAEKPNDYRGDSRAFDLVRAIGMLSSRARFNVEMSLENAHPLVDEASVERVIEHMKEFPHFKSVGVLRLEHLLASEYARKWLLGEGNLSCAERTLVLKNQRKASRSASPPGTR